MTFFCECGLTTVASGQQLLHCFSSLRVNSCVYISCSLSLSGIEFDTRILLTFFRYWCSYNIGSSVIFFSVIMLATVILEIIVRVTHGKSFSVWFNGKLI